jgi:hypothetical protein
MEASRHFLDGASTLLFQEGNTRFLMLCPFYPLKSRQRHI